MAHSCPKCRSTFRTRTGKAWHVARCNPSQLEMGKKVEREHTKTLKHLKKHPRTSIAKATERIAKDHLEEDPRYYTKLKAKL